jgi:transcriptional regulator with XRE-family HTH domain
MRVIERERIGRGWSQAQLARIAGMNAATISQIESGYIGQPYATQMAALCGALGWPTTEAATLLRDVDHAGD